ncbi:platelet glycoprotein Ib beta chain [Amia ocellicauda]|uniref:platelet glycoprotein Ib beta chain n=1 Tax=Amia ocellicauda TaxID=2972642 RepID=UPI003463955A
MNPSVELLPLLTLLFPLAVAGVHGACPERCVCHDQSTGLDVECSGRHLTTDMLPTRFPSDAVHIHLHGNRLTSLPQDLLDQVSGLPRLRTLSLHSNPWSCDCGLLPLRGWLLQQRQRGRYANLTCSSPPYLRGRALLYLSEEELLASCHYRYCDLAVVSQALLLVFILLQVLVLCVVIAYLRRFQRMGREARGAQDESMGVGQLFNTQYLPLKDRTE